MNHRNTDNNELNRLSKFEADPMIRYQDIRVGVLEN